MTNSIQERPVRPAAPLLAPSAAGLLTELCDQLARRPAFAGTFELIYAPIEVDVRRHRFLYGVVNTTRTATALHPHPATDLDVGPVVPSTAS